MRRLGLLFCGLILLCLLGCKTEPTSNALSGNFQKESPKGSENDYTTQALSWADSIVSSLDTTSLIGQLLMPSSYAKADYFTVRKVTDYVSDYKIGGIVWLKGDTLSMRTLSDTLSKISDVPLFMAIDAEWGLAMRLEGTEEFPKNYRLGDLADDSLYDYGYRLGKDAIKYGLNVVFAPVLDVSAGKKSVMFSRSYGGDPIKVADKGCSFARGLSDGGILPVAKHFPGLGATDIDSHRELPTVEDGLDKIESRDLYPFKRFIDNQLGAIMIGHVWMHSADSVPRPSTLSPVIVTELLRNKMNFEGLIFSDAMNMHALDNKGKELYVEALKAGADVLIVPENTKEAVEEIYQAIKRGDISMEAIKGKVRRILFYKYPRKVIK